MPRRGSRMENLFQCATVAKGPLEITCPKPLKRALPMLETRAAFLLLLSLMCVYLYGCDPVRTVQQSIVVRVVDERGTPVSDVRVRMKESWESWKLKGSEVPQAEEDDYYARWLSEPWLEGMTDVSGEALISSEVTALDWNKESAPPLERDVVSDHEYVVELSQQNVSEKVSIMLRQGATGKGITYTVSVESTGKPTYVNEPDA